MRRLLSAAVAVSFVFAGLSVSPAKAGDLYWSDTACWNHAPVYGVWYGQPGVGAAYASVFAADDWSNHGNSIVWYGQNLRYERVDGNMHSYYASLGYECGWAGFPISILYRGPNYYLKYFYVPGTCELRWLVEQDNGVVGPGYQPNYYC